eukprot:CAMPEP_0168542124 /NCGR_PEP_ID=MMETSP0413-20121227/1179_1 /TAXON_ID=136452 /ORGANISM="Filamoeba nolandi, Strain NC-AS-23-1" /LENGTH=128 /DNA_ID=CAMNT_0008571977 /DNA_START=388 /DNA_END=774 /DNA_ORIENTATION=-
MHTWFVFGAAALMVGALGRPSYMWFAIIGFQCSHLARVFAYDHMDTIASMFELVGIAFLCVCLAAEIVEGADPPATVWFAVSIFERFTHVPAALRRDAGWMKSYDLWLAVEKIAEDNMNKNKVEVMAA